MIPTFEPRRWVVRFDSELAGYEGDALAFRFLSPLAFEEVGPGRYKLTAPLRFYDPACGVRSIDVGFPTDFYSSPRWARWHTPRNEPDTNAAAVAHDWCVRNRKRLGLSLMDCHRIFRRAMLCAGVPPGKARARYWAVVLCGWAVAGKGNGIECATSAEERTMNAIRSATMACTLAAMVGGCTLIHRPMIVLHEGEAAEQVQAGSARSGIGAWFQRMIDRIRGKPEPKPPTPPTPPDVTPDPEPPKPDADPKPPAARAFHPWHRDLDRGVWPAEWRQYGSVPHGYDGRPAKPREFRGWVKLGNDYASIGGARYELRGLIEQKYRVLTVNNAVGAVMIEARADGVLRWWVNGDPLPTGPEAAPAPTPDEGGKFPPCPPATRPPTWSADGATAAKFGGGTLWNPAASKGPKLVLASKWNGKAASTVTAWGGGQQIRAERWKDAEEGNRQRWYFPRALPASLTLRVHVPGGTDFVLHVPDTSKRVDR